MGSAGLNKMENIRIFWKNNSFYSICILFEHINHLVYFSGRYIFWQHHEAKHLCLSKFPLARASFGVRNTEKVCFCFHSVRWSSSRHFLFSFLVAFLGEIIKTHWKSQLSTRKISSGQLSNAQNSVSEH